jgi:hypothetical protein
MCMVSDDQAMAVGKVLGRVNSYAGSCRATSHTVTTPESLAVAKSEPSGL